MAKNLGVADLQGQTVAALVSGGLDSTSIIRWLTNHGVRVVAITADLRQPDETDMQDILVRMKAAGAVEAILVDAWPLLANYMLTVIQGQAYHEGGYWNTTGIARMATVAAALPEIQKRDIQIVTHGATGRGNDQVRFELGFAMLNPTITIYAPWRDPAFLADLPGRQEMIKFCQEHGLSVRATSEKPYSTDANGMGLTHEAGQLELLTTPADFVSCAMTCLPWRASDLPEEVIIVFEEGKPVSVNGKEMALPELFLALNEIGGRHGIGFTNAIENRRVGIKSRGVYEAPGVTCLAAAYAIMIQLILDRNRRKFFDIVSRQLADVVYEGEWFGPLADDLRAVVENIARKATGNVILKFYRGNMIFVSASSPHSLYDPNIASMENVGDFNHADAQGYLNIAGVTARAMARVGLLD